MQSTHYAIRGHTLVVLDKVYTVSKDWSYFLIELSLRKALEEIATGIHENAWFYYKYAINGGFNNFHLLLCFEHELLEYHEL